MDLGPVERITTDAVGEPGFRVFYLQARSVSQTVTVIVEKQQVQLLAASVLELLADLELETAASALDEALELEEPFDPRWRAGRLSIGYECSMSAVYSIAPEFCASQRMTRQHLIRSRRGRRRPRRSACTLIRRHSPVV